MDFSKVDDASAIQYFSWQECKEGMRYLLKRALDTLENLDDDDKEQMINDLDYDITPITDIFDRMQTVWVDEL